MFPRLARSLPRAGVRLAARRSFLAPLSLASSRSHFNAVSTTNSFSTEAIPKSVKNPDMFCRQCEQTADHYACTTVGVCGKDSTTAASQDALMHVIKSVAVWCVAARNAGATAEQLKAANVWSLEATFSTLTNVNFDEERIAQYAQQGMKLVGDLKQLTAGSSPPPASEVRDLDLSGMSILELEEFGRSVSIPKRQAKMGNDDCFSLNEICTYGMRGLSAYAMHCHMMGAMDETIMKDVHEIWAKIASDEPDMEGLLATALRVGEVNGRVMALLDGQHAEHFGAPEPTQCRTTMVEGKAILISGHDMTDLYELLKQTEGTGVNVYTHGEMLPAHGYPKLKAFKHLAGNYGTAWQNQKFEFATFPGPIILTSNCMMEPRRSYKNHIYTMNAVGYEGVKHIGPEADFSAVIEQAQSMKGFPRTVEPAEYLTVGFNHRAVLPHAGTVIEAAQKGDLSRIFLIGGCDGSQWERSYYTDLAEALPDNSLILTLGCAKNRFIRSEKLLGATLGDTGLPRVLDMGQCNDAYSAVVVAIELAKALNCSVNDLPLSLVLSHLEQKAAAVLLTLLSMGVKNIRLGPSLPAFITPNVLKVLVDNYNLMPTGEVDKDLVAMMEGK